MSDTVDKKGLHILLGLCGLDEGLIRALKEEFEKKDMSVDICASKYQKLGIEQYVKENNDIDVVIVSEYLQKSKPYLVSDFEVLNDLNNRMMIIPILSDDKKGSQYISNLLSIGVYTALFESHASLSAIVDMVIHGRTRKEARYYYGTESVNEIGETANIQTCIDHIAFGGDIELTKERADYVRTKTSKSEFEIIISRLPQEILDRLKVFDDYTEFFEEMAKRNEKKSIFPNKLKKNIISETGDQENISLIVKQGVLGAVKKVVIGFAGTQSRIGTTHQTILFGNYLNNAGYKIAIVENSECESKAFLSIGKRYKVKEQEDFFSFQNVDYYPNFRLEELNRIFLKDYNFVLIDFGVYNENISMEFGRCVIQIIVSGSKTWELPLLEKLMIQVNDEEILKEFNYLFMFTPESEKKSIIKNMDVLNKVYFSDYQSDPFSSKGYEATKLILENYLPEAENISRKEKFFGKIQKLFE